MFSSSSQKFSSRNFYLFGRKQRMYQNVLERASFIDFRENRDHGGVDLLKHCGYSHKVASIFKETRDLPGPPAWSIGGNEIPWNDATSCPAMLDLMYAAEASSKTKWDILQVIEFVDERTFKRDGIVEAKRRNRPNARGRGRGRGRGKGNYKGGMRNRKDLENHIVPMHLIQDDLHRILDVPVFCSATIMIEEDKRRQEMTIQHNSGLETKTMERTIWRKGIKHLSNTDPSEPAYIFSFMQLKRQGKDAVKNWWDP
jgi:hypothetical protein